MMLSEKIGEIEKIGIVGEIEKIGIVGFSIFHVFNINWIAKILQLQGVQPQILNFILCYGHNYIQHYNASWRPSLRI